MSQIYFIQEENDGPIKIGICINVLKRLSGIQVGTPRLLRLLAHIPGDAALERKLHKQFSSSNIRGEWFRPDEVLLNYISTLPPYTQVHVDRSKGENHTAWKGVNAGLITKQARFRRRFPLTICEKCGHKAKDRHCIDGNYENLVRSNIIMLCRVCTMTHDGRMEKLKKLHNRERPPAKAKECTHCHRFVMRHRHGLCGACSEYKRRNNIDRPLEFIVRNNKRLQNTN